MRIRGINNIISEIDTYENVKKLFIDNRKIKPNGNIRVKNIGDLYLLEDIAKDYDMLEHILNIKTNIFTFYINYLFPPDDTDIVKLLDLVSKSKSKYKIIVIYMILYITTFNLYHYRSEEQYKNDNKIKYKTIKKIVEAQTDETKTLGTFLIKIINAEFNETYLYFHNILTHINLLYESKIKNKKKSIETRLSSIIFDNSTISINEYEVFIIIIELMRDIITTNVNKETIWTMLELLSKSKIVITNLLRSNFMDNNKQTTHFRISIAIENLIIELINNNYNEIALLFISNIDGILVRDLLETLPRDILYSKINGKELHVHLQYLKQTKNININ